MQQVHHIQALLDIGASACFIDKRYVKHKVALVKKATPIIIEVINIWSFVLKPLTLETKALEVIMLDHILVMQFSMSFHP